MKRNRMAGRFIAGFAIVWHGGRRSCTDRSVGTGDPNTDVKRFKRLLIKAVRSR